MRLQWGESTAEDEDLLADPFADGLGEILSPSAGRGPVTFGNGSPLQVTIYLALGADLTADPSTWVLTNVTAWTRIAGGITVRTGRTDESSVVGPGSGSVVFDNTDGRFSRRNPLGPYYGLLSRNTPILVEVNAGNGGYALMRQYVNEWPARVDKSLSDFTVPVRTGGILRRLGQGTSLSQSALRRAISGDSDLVQYWPCEDGTDARTLASALGVGSPLSMIGTVAPGTSTATGIASDALPVLSTGLTYLKGSTGMASARAWTYSATYYFTSVPVFTAGDGTADLLYCAANQAGTLVRWVVYWNDADNTVYLEIRTNSTTVATVAGPVLTNAEMVNCWLTFWVSASQDGSDVDYAFGVERTTTSGVSSQATSGTVAAQTVYQLDGMLIFNGKSAAATTVGHAFVLSRALTSSQNTPAYQAVNGWIGETATARMTRLTGEEGVPFTIPSGVESLATMGAQSRGTFLEGLRECESVDGGVLYEDGWGLGYQPLSARYNLVPAMALNLSGGYVAAEPEPTDDDQQLRNQWTVTRTDGTEATASDAESIADEGLYADSATLNVETDDQAEQIAAWRVHVGTNPDLRWPSLTLRFDTPTGILLIPSWTSMPYGQRITISAAPYQVMTAGDLIDLLAEGRTETVDEFTWLAELYTSPARPYDVFTLEDPLYGRLSSDGSTLATANLSARAEGNGSTTKIVVADASAVGFSIGNLCRIHDQSGALKENTTVTITSMPSAFGFTEINFTPALTQATAGVFGGPGDYIRRVDETSLSVATTNSGSPLWTTAAADMPFDLEVAGERITVTAISGASSPQTFTVVRTVNGIQKAHSAGTEVRLWYRTPLAL